MFLLFQSNLNSFHGLKISKIHSHADHDELATVKLVVICDWAVPLRPAYKDTELVGTAIY